jgi:phenylacetaldehyde dehydrogenase
MLIDGRWLPAASGKTFPVTDPATGEVIAQVAEGDNVDIDHGVKAARRAFEAGAWPTMSPSARGKLIWRIGDLILEHLDELAELESLDNGKPLEVAKVADVPLAADMFHYMAGWTTKRHGITIPAFGALHALVSSITPTRVPSRSVWWVKLYPWNFPLLMAAWKLHRRSRPVARSSSRSRKRPPLRASAGRVLLEAGLPNGVVNIITGYGETAGAALASHPGVDKVAFTGSTEVGRLIVKAAANDLKKVSLELGGKSPNIVLQDADLDVAIPGAANAIFFNHGQCCNAGSRLYVAQSIFDKVVEGVADVAKKIKLGPGLAPTTEMGPLVSEIQLNRVCGYLEAGTNEGARTIVGGKRREGRGYFVEPTVLVDTRPDMKVVQEEIWPVVTAMPFVLSTATSSASQ